MSVRKQKALLVLADGTVFEGLNFGSEGETIGEVVFNTSMTGYQEILTDPSYKGQIVVMTYTQIGNYGINTEDIESGIPNIEGFIAKEFFDFPSNWRSKNDLGKYLKEHNKVCIDGIDTRALTRHLRDNGVQPGIISTEDLNPESLIEKVKKHPGISSLDLVSEVTTKEPYKWTKKLWKLEDKHTTIKSINPPLPPFAGETPQEKLRIQSMLLMVQAWETADNMGFLAVVPIQVTTKSPRRSKLAVHACLRW